jgi:hypothetical protein
MAEVPGVPVAGATCISAYLLIVPPALLDGLIISILTGFSEKKRKGVVLAPCMWPPPSEYDTTCAFCNFSGGE